MDILLSFIYNVLEESDGYNKPETEEVFRETLY